MRSSATTTEALDRIGALYRIEDTIRGKPPDERRRVRQNEARPRLDALKGWIEATLSRLSAKTEVAKAMRYALGRWTALSRYVDDGTLEIDNNAAERSIRGIALGRKNWLFAGSDAGGERAAAFYSLIETCLCRARHRDVYAARRTMPSRFVFPRFLADRHLNDSA